MGYWPTHSAELLSNHRVFRPGCVVASRRHLPVWEPNSHSQRD